jgi:hypothetical protein
VGGSCRKLALPIIYIYIGGAQYTIFATGPVFKTKKNKYQLTATNVHNWYKIFRDHNAVHGEMK